MIGRVEQAMSFVSTEIGRQVRYGFSPIDKKGDNEPIVEADQSKIRLIAHHTIDMSKPGALTYQMYLAITRSRRPRFGSKRPPKEVILTQVMAQLSGKELGNGQVVIDWPAQSCEPDTEGKPPRFVMPLQFTVGYDGKTCGWYIVNRAELVLLTVFVRELMSYFKTFREEAAR